MLKNLHFHFEFIFVYGVRKFSSFFFFFFNGKKCTGVNVEPLGRDS